MQACFCYVVNTCSVHSLCSTQKVGSLFRTHFSGLMLPKLCDTFRCKLFIRFVALNSIQCFSKTVLVVRFLKSLVAELPSSLIL